MPTENDEKVDKLPQKPVTIALLVKGLVTCLINNPVKQPIIRQASILTQRTAKEDPQLAGVRFPTKTRRPPPKKAPLAIALARRKYFEKR